MSSPFGLIQPWVEPGNFQRNLRQIIELYRFCLDEGSPLILAPSLALSGGDLGDLIEQSAFRAQHDHALAFLAQEANFAPILIPEWFYEDGHWSIHALWLHQGIITDLGKLTNSPHSNGQSILTTSFLHHTLILAHPNCDIDKLFTIYSQCEHPILIEFTAETWHIGNDPKQEIRLHKYPGITNGDIYLPRIAGIVGYGAYLGQSIRVHQGRQTKLHTMGMDALACTRYTQNDEISTSPVVISGGKRLSFYCRMSHKETFSIHFSFTPGCILTLSMLATQAWSTPIGISNWNNLTDDDHTLIDQLFNHFELIREDIPLTKEKYIHLVPSSLTEQYLSLSTSFDLHQHEFYINPIGDLLDTECLKDLSEREKEYCRSNPDFNLQEIDTIISLLIDDHASPTFLTSHDRWKNKEAIIRKIQKNIESIRTYSPIAKLIMRKRNHTPIFHTFRD